MNTTNLKDNLHIYESTGNRFLIFNDTQNIYTLSKKNDLSLYKDICHRLIVAMYRQRADSTLILLQGIKKHSYSFIILERDGTESFFCGNGLRSLALFCLQHTIKHKKNYIEFIVDKKIYGVQQLNKDDFESRMGEVNATPKLMRHYLTKRLLNHTYPQILNELNRQFITSPRLKIIGIADIGKEPHIIVHIPEQFDVFNKKSRLLAQTIMQKSTIFPIGINVDFLRFNRSDMHKIWLDTFERGVNDFTDSCGSGAICSVFAMLYNHNNLNSAANVEVITMGGILNVTVDSDNHYYLSGSVKYVTSL